MAEKHDILILPNQGDSSIVLSGGRSSLAARGRKDAAGLVALRKAPMCLAAVQTRSGAREGNWGFIDRSGTFAIPPNYKWVGCFSEKRACFSWIANGEPRPAFISWCYDHGKKDEDGIRFLFRYGQYQGRLPNDSLGYMDIMGEPVVSPQFICAEPFRGGIARVAKSEKRGTGFIDVEGRPVGSLEFDEAANFQDGFAVVQIGDRYGAITREGEYALPPKFDYVWDFTEGLARVLVGEKVGFVNGCGDFVIDPIFDAAEGFHEGKAAVCVERDWGYIDKAGAFVVGPQFWYAGNFRDGKAEVEDWDADRDPFRGSQKPFWIDTSGNAVAAIETESDDELQSIEGRVRIRQDDLWGFQDSSGTYVVKPSFDDAGEFSIGLARVMNHQRLWGYIDQDGQVRIPFVFHDARDFLLGNSANIKDH